MLNLRVVMKAVARTAAPVRLQAHPWGAGPAGHRDEPEKAAQALPRGKAPGPPPGWPQTGSGDAPTDGSAKRRERMFPLGDRKMIAPRAMGSLDFISDAFRDGRRFRVLTVVDDFTRKCLALVADTSLSGAKVARKLDAVVSRRGRPGTIVSNNGKNSPQRRSCLGLSARASVGTKSRLENPCRTASSKASMGGCMTSS